MEFSRSKHECAAFYPGVREKRVPAELNFHERLAALRKKRGLTQQALSEMVGTHPDEDLKLQFEAVSRLDPEEKKVVRSVIESIILRPEARRWSTVDSGGSR